MLAADPISKSKTKRRRRRRTRQSGFLSPIAPSSFVEPHLVLPYFGGGRFEPERTRRTCVLHDSRGTSGDPREASRLEARMELGPRCDDRPFGHDSARGSDPRDAAAVAARLDMTGTAAARRGPPRPGRTRGSARSVGTTRRGVGAGRRGGAAVLHSPSADNGRRGSGGRGIRFPTCRKCMGTWSCGFSRGALGDRSRPKSEGGREGVGPGPGVGARRPSRTAPQARYWWLGGRGRSRRLWTWRAGRV